VSREEEHTFRGKPKMTESPSLIAFHLPQFHPIPENDRWWGKGFTEWTNVTRAKPMFVGHDQPHLPADLGFYDLRLPEARAAQAELAREYGIHGFCYYHYWFNGRRLLERPFNDILDSGEPDFPFCLCWANEPWSRRWLGEERDILMPQSHSPEDDLAHGRWLARAFADRRYIRVDDRPVFLVYRPAHLAEPLAAVARIREAVMGEGLPNPLMVGVDAHCPGTDCRTFGFDLTMAFEPQLGVLPMFMRDGSNVRRLVQNAIRRGVPNGRLKLYDEGEARRTIKRIARPFPHYRCAFVSWDNSPRRGADGIIMVGGSPELFEADLRSTIESARGDGPPGDAIVFVNAWNEWAEGNHLEPDRKHGRAYLEAVRKVVLASAGGSHD
jgi:Glycosyltransferase WbsX